SASLRLASAVERLLRDCPSCWSTSGVAITAKSCPFFTCAPISKYQACKYPLVREKIGAVTYGCTFPGNTISCEGADRCGETTETVGTAICAVSVRNAALVWTRSRIPDTKSAAKARKIASAMSQLRRERLALGACCPCPCTGTCCVVSGCIGITPSDCIGITPSDCIVR